MDKSIKWGMFLGLVFALLLGICLANSYGVFAAERSVNYSDVKEGDWYMGAVSDLSQMGIINGYQDGSFKPSGVVTFGEFLKMMVLATEAQVSDERSNNEQAKNEPNSKNWELDYFARGLALGLYTKWDIDESDLEKPIPRKYMALVIGTALGASALDGRIPNYQELLSAVRDIKAGDDYEYEMMKAYSAGILTGYPSGNFKPNGTLTRAEAAMAVYRFLEQQPSDPEDKAMEAWYNGSNISTNNTNTYWLLNESFKPQVRGQFRLSLGKLYMQEVSNSAVDLKERNRSEWNLKESTYKDINEDIYKVLKAYWKIAVQEGYFITISGGRGISYDTVSIILSERDGPNFPRTSSFSFNDGKPPLTGAVQPFVVFDMGMNYRLTQLEALIAGADWRDSFLAKGRILDESLVQLNRNLLIELYGQSGAQIYDFALSKYKKHYVKDNADAASNQGSGGYLKLVDLPNEGKTIGGVPVYFDDDATSRITLYIGPH